MIVSRLLEESRENVIGFIASSVEQIGERLERVEQQMVTKDAFEVAITALRGDIEQVNLRLDTMDHNIASRFEHV